MSTNHPIGAFIVVDEELDARLTAAKTLGIPTAQIMVPQAERRTLTAAETLKSKLAGAGVTPTVVFCGFEGESYADIPTVVKTVGLVPKETREERICEAKAISDFAKMLGVSVTALHIGFVPEDRNDQDYIQIVAVARDLCDHCKANGQRLHLETGQETVETLLRFIGDVDRDNLAVNFDPANMILYGSGEPIAALKMIGKYVKSVHCKDAKWSAKPKIEWGEEVPLGKGDVGMENFLQTLKEIGYVGPLTIEREISGEQQIKDIGEAVKLLENLREKVWGG